MDKYQYLFGFNSIDNLVADHEFIGSEWLEYPIFYIITYYIRMRENFDVIMPKNGKKVKATWLFSWLKIGQYNHYSKIVNINKVACYLSICKCDKVKNRSGGISISKFI